MLFQRAEHGDLRILLVDDYPETGVAFTALLSLLGHTCRSVMRGVAALEEAERFAPDVVLCDLMLPDISGYDVGRELRARHGNKLYLVAITGRNGPAHDRTRALAAGFDQHLLKPVSVDTLRTAITASQGARISAQL